MSNIPKKLFWMLGYNNLTIILEQERRHWLLKTDKNKQVQDKITGDVFQGKVDNTGSDVVIESQKLPYKYTIAPEITFTEASANDVLTPVNSAFPHSAAVNGFMFERIISTNYRYGDGDDDFNHFKIKFENAVECILPFGASSASNEVYADKWLKTTTPPTVMILNKNTGTYSITQLLRFNTNITNPVWYYPLSETLQPLDITDMGHGTYEMAAVNDDGYIGYPLFWFTCDQTNVGSDLTFDSNNINGRSEQIFFVSNEGNASPFNAKVYTDIDGDCDATPDGTATSNYSIKCAAKFDNPFEGNDSDFFKAVDPQGISLVNNTTQTDYPIEFLIAPSDSNYKITMTKDIPWVYDSTNNVYTIAMDYFDQNCIESVEVQAPLVSVFDVVFDSNIPFVQASTDVGIAGIQMSSANINSDVYERYPYNLNRWEGLPEWLNELEDGLTPEHMAIYAMHQPPSYNPEDPETMQGAALLLDPGKHDGAGVSPNEKIGRVYVLSNDDIEYKNNATERYPKPDRTAARICDIPTSVIQLAGTTGHSPDPIVDKKYVRTQASFGLADKNRLYNVDSNRWVRPTAENADGVPVYEALAMSNKFAFESEEELNEVDLVNHNEFRRHENLNPMVDSSKVSIESIVNGGEGYQVRDQGVCIIGGYAFIYEVQEATEIDPDTHEGGRVISAAIIPPAEEPGTDPKMIALSNFDMNWNSGGRTYDYGTSPTSGSGHGLKIALVIEPMYFRSILPYKGEIFTDLFAFVRRNDGAFVYEYKIDQSSRSTPKTGVWEETLQVSEFEITSYMKEHGGVATQEAFINSILPSMRELPVSMKTDHIAQENLTVSQTASFLNVLDKTKSPIVPAIPSNEDDTSPVDNIVDITKLRCDAFIECKKVDGREAYTKNVSGVLKRIKDLGLTRYDCYILWRWVDADDSSNRDFVCGIVYRGFINQMTNDTVTMLPANKLYDDNYVHTNPGTTIVWNVPGIGTMVWIYDPTYRYKEDYYIDPETMQLHISRKEMKYSDIDVIVDGDGLVEPIVDSDNRLLWNIMSNNIVKASPDVIPIYQQTGVYQLRSGSIGVDIDRMAEDEKPCGNWRLVLPKIEYYSLESDQSSTQYIPQKLEVIRAGSMSDTDNISDSAGNIVNMKCLMMDDSDGVHFKAYNRNTRRWETI